MIDVENIYKNKLPEIVTEITKSCRKREYFDHINTVPIPSKESVEKIIKDLEDVLFPGFFGEQEIYWETLEYHIGMEINKIFNNLSQEITKAVRQLCQRNRDFCVHCVEKGYEITFTFLKRLPEIRRLLAGDIHATFDGDPAAQNFSEIVFAYPGLKAITIYRLAHELHNLKVPFIPRIMTEYAHSVTGTDIHPGAKIGEKFFIDHATGVVIGETSEIGNNVRIYQGVTLGALSFPVDEHGNIMRGKKRHPTIEDEVIIYSNATILGTPVIGKGSIIGGNTWITESVPPFTKVVLAKPDLVFIERQRKR
ncbi:MAG: serine acetyltransferase [Candidatus Schekmanbacteria bacterium RBG_13_48_7]|uniref:Serine acetyltransferase n=1 Tax=Candidatus Schekmanbacteria bacterium RBG_13_48_7 TaxID=1817878 RepID=A0A1F7RXQ5_9BACT|nr:MAG: serine acetyltransferase [Candidatus Schekmanbacteria bacterium RBG_13_48_7]